MLKKLLELLPTFRAMSSNLDEASERVSLSIKSYRNASRELQEEIAKNGFARYLIHDKGE
ncbi:MULTISPECIES: hypothetical protein [unclassified Paenibacillus]|uniref:hypothetical protein n=1 Tax=unclassified Paenibacillus TaxID=185978 RepID=UPI00038F2D10|nr:MULTISPECIES: hypothetical protein [unclassified Paenibacillus]ASS64690.1 hypothetical protein CIC07_00145 [Paenibacillus sp. RUD330]ASS66540.1 hypothetical protein CIC07_10505 [Paenibacillus sp. RUD330]CDN41472.1 Uncharacterized protein BN871_AH_00460 [Paenibacillus sp. P22]